MNSQRRQTRPFFLMIGFLLGLSQVHGTANAQRTSNESSEQSESMEAYQNHWPLAQQDFANSNFDSALAHYKIVSKALPFEPSCRFEMARCLAKLERHEEAIDLLSEAVEFGWDDTERLRNASEFQTIRESKTFAEVVEAARRCRQESIILYAGSKIDAKQPAGLIVFLQGLGCHPRADIPYWRDVADERGMILVAPRAAHEFGSLLYGWQSSQKDRTDSSDFYDLESATEKIKQAIELAKKDYKIDEQAVVLAGFSQGGGVAAQLLSESPEEFSKALIVCGLLIPIETEIWRQANQKVSLRITVIAGQHDRLLGRSKRLRDSLEQADVTHQFRVDPNTGHEYPVDYKAMFDDALDFLLNQE